MAGITPLFGCLCPRVGPCSTCVCAQRRRLLTWSPASLHSQPYALPAALARSSVRRPAGVATMMSGGSNGGGLAELTRAALTSGLPPPSRKPCMWRCSTDATAHTMLTPLDCQRVAK